MQPRVLMVMALNRPSSTLIPLTHLPHAILLFANNLRRMKSSPVTRNVIARPSAMQPRVLMAMARDGLLPRWFSRLSPSTGTPTNATVTSGLVAAVMAFAMNIDQLSGMVRTASI
jgi:amino acid transporter